MDDGICMYPQKTKWQRPNFKYWLDFINSTMNIATNITEESS